MRLSILLVKVKNNYISLLESKYLKYMVHIKSTFYFILYFYPYIYSYTNI
jgi:hypothetical protein